MAQSRLIDCIAIAYQWHVTPANFDFYDVELTLSITRSQFRPANSHVQLEKTWSKLKPKLYVYHANLSPN